ncbi:MAG: BTAD domain-containing putative transcriptional regulator [Gemmatimonadota bacterium]
MNQLRVLGGIELRTTDPDGARHVLSQPKRVALLTALMLHAKGGSVRRDTIVGLLWPELDASRASNAMSQSLHHLRKALGPGVFERAGAGALSVRHEMLWCDAVAFRDALETGTGDESTLDLYRGELLPGLYVSGALEFERWLEDERSRLRHAADELAARLTQERVEAGDEQQAVRIARRALFVSPHDERATRRLMEVLEWSGDRRAALEEYEAFREHMRKEYGAAPSEDSQALASRIRDSAESPHQTMPPRKPPRSFLRPTTRDGVESTTQGDEATSTASPRRSMLPLWGTAAVVTLVAGAWAVTTLGGRAEASLPLVEPADKASRLAVLPFTVRGQTPIDDLGAGLVTLLATRLDGVGGLYGVDPHALLGRVDVAPGMEGVSPETARRIAADFAAQYFVLGDVIASGDEIELSASLYTRDQAEPVSQARVRGGAGTLIDLVDQLAVELLSSEVAQPGSRTADLADFTTVDLEALKAYLEGDRRLRAGRFGQAVELFEEAVARDSTFALAWYRLGVASLWADDVPRTAMAIQSAERHRARLSPRAAALLDAFRPYMGQSYALADQRYRDVLERWPNELEAWYMLGESFFHGGADRGLGLVESRPMFERVLALDPNNSEALLHLIRIAASDRVSSDFDDYSLRFLEMNSGADRTLEVRALRAYRDASPTLTRRVLEDVAETSDVIVALSAIAVAVYLQNFDGAAELTEALLQRPGGSYHGWAQLMMVRLNLARGRFTEARAGWASAQSGGNDRGGVLLLARWAAVSDRLTGSTVLARADFSASPTSEFRRADGYALALEASARSGPSTPEVWADALAELPRLAPELELWRAVHREDPLSALTALEERMRDGDDAPVLVPQEALLFADLSRSQGQVERGLPWLLAMGRPSGYDISFIPLAHLAAARALEQSDPSRATARYRAFADLWAGADEAFRPAVADALDRAAALSR